MVFTKEYLENKMMELNAAIKAIQTDDKEGKARFKEAFPEVAEIANTEILIAVLTGMKEGCTSELEKIR